MLRMLPALSVKPEDVHEVLGVGDHTVGLVCSAIAQLVDRLEDNSLDYRVLAVQDLAEITGKRLMANPAANQAERTLAIRKWRARLDAGDLKPVAAQ